MNPDYQNRPSHTDIEECVVSHSDAGEDLGVGDAGKEEDNSDETYEDEGVEGGVEGAGVSLRRESPLFGIEVGRVHGDYCCGRDFGLGNRWWEEGADEFRSGRCNRSALASNLHMTSFPRISGKSKNRN